MKQSAVVDLQPDPTAPSGQVPVYRGIPRVGDRKEPSPIHYHYLAKGLAVPLEITTVNGGPLPWFHRNAPQVTSEAEHEVSRT